MNRAASDAHRSASESRRAMRSALESRLNDAPEPRGGVPPIPDHVLLERIGSGAYGEIWLARSALGTLRAVKVVYRERFEDDRPFQREFHGILKYEPVSRTHEGLMAILHVGRNEDAGCFYYVMELADNANGTKHAGRPGAASSAPAPGAGDASGYKARTLQSELSGGRALPAVQAAQLALGVAEGLAHLHKHGLVHRDVKPSNVIFVNGRPKLADIGLITTAGDSRSFVGTEGFIPPEGPGSPQADTYALGKLLYEMATGSDRLEFPRLPAQLPASSEGGAVLELNEIITRACAPNPRARYRSATEMVADLNLFLSGRSLRDSRRLERHVLWLKRFAVTACIVLALAALALWVAKSREREAKERERTTQARAQLESALRQRAEAAERESHQQLYAALLEQARATVHGGEMGQRVRALEAVQRAATISNSWELRSVALAALTLPDLRFERALPRAPGLTVVQMDPAFERIAAGRGSAAVEITPADGGRLLAMLPASTNTPAYYLGWSPDGRYLGVKRDTAAEGELANIEIWEVATAKQIALIKGVPYGAFAFAKGRPLAITGLGSNEVALWDLTDGRVITRFNLPGNPAFFAFSPSADRFAAGWQGSNESSWMVSVHDSATGRQLSAQGNFERVTYLDWHPFRDLILTADHSSRIRLMDPQTGTTRTLGRHKAQSVLALFSPDGRYAITGGWERQLICWDLKTMQRAFRIDSDSFVAQFRADGRKCAIVTDSAIEIFSLEQSVCDHEFGEDLGGRVYRAVFSPDGHWLAVPGHDRLGVWDLTSDGPGALVPLGGNPRPFFSADSRELFASGDEDCLRYRLTPSKISGAPPRLDRLDLPIPEGYTSLCLVSNEVILTTTNGSRIGQLEDGLIVQGPMARTSNGISGASPDARWFAVFRPYSTVLHVYHLPGLEPVTALTNGLSILDFSFSATGEELVVTSRTQVDFWSTKTWRHVRTLPHCMGILYDSATGPWWLQRDFQRADLCDGKTLRPMVTLSTGILPIALSPDQKLLAVSVDSHRVQLWNLPEIRTQFRRLGIDWN